MNSCVPKSRVAWQHGRMTARRIMILTSRSLFLFSSDGAFRVGGPSEGETAKIQGFVLEKSRKNDRIQEWQFTLEGNAMYLDFKVRYL